MPHKRDKTVIFSGKGRPIGLYMYMYVRVSVINTIYKVKEESEKVGFKAQHSENRIMVSGPITSWQIDGETVETVADFIFGGCRW